MSLLKSQYLYINSALRNNGNPWLFDVNLAPVIRCAENEQLRISIVSFKLTRTWNWINSTNNMFGIRNTTLGIDQTYKVPDGNYTFRKLASTMTALIHQFHPELADVQVKYDPSRGQFYILGDGSNQILFDYTKSICSVLRFPKSDFYLMGSSPVYNTGEPLSIDKAAEFRMYIENIPTSNTAVNYENDIGSQLQPSNCVFVMRADIAPGSTAYYTAQEILFSLDVDEKQIQTMRFSLRDEKGNFIDYAPDYLFTVRVDTISTGQEVANEQVTLLKEILEYQRLQFVGTNIANV